MAEAIVHEQAAVVLSAAHELARRVSDVNPRRDLYKCAADAVLGYCLIEAQGGGPGTLADVEDWLRSEDASTQEKVYLVATHIGKKEVTYSWLPEEEQEDSAPSRYALHIAFSLEERKRVFNTSHTAGVKRITPEVNRERLVLTGIANSIWIGDEYRRVLEQAAQKV